MDLKALAEKFNPYQIEMRRYFHAHPEPSTKEVETAKKIREELTRAGIEWRPCGKNLTTGTLATIHGGKPGKTFLLRGDIDGLSVKEKTGLPFASQNDGFMHACGHDCHISMLLTAVMIANSIRDEIPGTIKFIFQPAEEVALGALDMMADGVLDGVDGMCGPNSPRDRCRLKRAAGWRPPISLKSRSPESRATRHSLISALTPRPAWLPPSWICRPS